MKLEKMFRGVDKGGNGDIVYGALSRDPIETVINHIGLTMNKTDSIGYFLDGKYFIEVYKDSIAMNTGLKDSNGIDIYGSIDIDGMTKGGDIINIDNEYHLNYTCVVVYDTDTAMFWANRHYTGLNGIKKSYDESIREYLNKYHTIKIIGNHYQNKELL